MRTKMGSPKSTPHFQDLLLRYSQYVGEDRGEQIERELWANFGTISSVLVVDMSGYSRCVRDYGVVHYLSMIRRLQLTIQPIVENFRGTIVGFFADNADARFDSPVDAIQACIALNLALDSANIMTRGECDVHVSCGIDHGECLIPNKSQMFGNPVIRASKLGEDLGMPGQILVTKEAMECVPSQSGFFHEPINVELAGKCIEVHSIDYRRADTASQCLMHGT